MKRGKKFRILRKRSVWSKRDAVQTKRDNEREPLRVMPHRASLGWLSGEESTRNAGPQAFPGEGGGSPRQYSCQENSMDEEPGRLQSMES